MISNFSFVPTTKKTLNESLSKNLGFPVTGIPRIGFLHGHNLGALESQVLSGKNEGE